MTLTAAEKTLYQERLAEAEQAYHELKTGRSARVYVDQNGERIEYAVANAERLQAYVLELKTILGVKLTPHIVGPLRPWFL